MNDIFSPALNPHMRLNPLAGVEIKIVDAQAQKRTPRDVRGPWVRPRCMSKRRGRKGTRRAWKRANAPHYVWLYREPTDVLMIDAPRLGPKVIIATPLQYDAIKRDLAR